MIVISLTNELVFSSSLCGAFFFDSLKAVTAKGNCFILIISLLYRAEVQYVLLS